MTSKKNLGGRVMVLLLASLLFAAACTGSATIDETVADSDEQMRPVPQDEPTAVPATAAPEPTAVGEPVGPEPTAPSTPTRPESSPATEAPGTTEPVDFRADAILGFSSDGAFAYAGTTTAWDNPTACNLAPIESIAVTEVATAAAGEFAAVGAGLVQAGDVRQLLPNRDGRVAILSTCGPTDDPTSWLQFAGVGDGGQLIDVGDPIPLAGEPAVGDPVLIRWTEANSVEIRVIVEVDPDDFETWQIERRYVVDGPGEPPATQRFGYFDEDGFVTNAGITTDQGFTYRAIDDPAGGVGCEGFGIARSLELDDGEERRPALGVDGLATSDIGDLQLSASGHIAWTSGCEGFISAYVGKIQPDGSIIDAHLIQTFDLPSENYTEYMHYRLTDDGFLVAVGPSFDTETGEDRGAAFLRYDLATDPNFVNTADPALEIDADPLLISVNGQGSWHVGETLGAVRACGGRTLYGKTSTGFVRAFGATVEIDAIVDMDAGETRRTTLEDGAERLSRTIVVSTVCPGEYEGLRLYFGIEPDNIQWGLWLDQADMETVRNVLSVRDEVEPGTSYPQRSFVEVETFDGTVTELELIRLPSN